MITNLESLSMDDLLTLTDDEVVALAATQSVSWPGGAPTVEPNPESVADAVFRGNRSLYVRGLLDDAADAGAQSLSSTLISAGTKVMMYLGAADFRRIGWGIATVLYNIDERWVLEHVDPTGIHRLAWATDADVRDYVVAMLQGAMEVGPAMDAEPEAPWLCALTVAADNVVLVIARRGTIQVAPAKLGDDGVPVVGGDFHTANPDSAATALLAATASPAQ